MKEVHGSSPWGAGACALLPSLFSLEAYTSLISPLRSNFRFDAVMPSRRALNLGYNHHICYHFNNDSGTYSDADGHRQPSQVELDIATHQATCVGCSLASARPLTLFLVTSPVSPAPWPRAELREILPLLLPALVTGGVPQAQVVLNSGSIMFQLEASVKSQVWVHLLFC